MFYRLLLLGMLLLAGSIQCFAISGGSSVDPFYLEPITAMSTNVSGRTPVAVSTVAGAGTAVIVIQGQSNAQNTSPTAYSPTNTNKIFNFNIYDGALYPAQDPQLGTVGIGGSFTSCFCFRLADKLITAGKYTKVILVPIAVGGTSFAEWTPGGVDLTGAFAFNLSHRIIATANRLAAAGLTVTAIINMQGEADNSLGTSAANVTASINAIVDTWRAAGVNAKFFQSLTSWAGGATSTTTRTGETNAVDHVTRLIWQGPDTDTLNNTNRQDGTHWNDTGADAVAGLWSTNLQANLP